jgi:hypothetical protein
MKSVDTDMHKADRSQLRWLNPITTFAKTPTIPSMPLTSKLNEDFVLVQVVLVQFPGQP